MEKEEVQKDKRKTILIASIVVVGIILIAGISYAFWQMTRVQEDKNIIASGCFDVTLEGENPINLSSAYPMTSEEGMGTTPYTFTIKNTCNSGASYVVNLEALEETTFLESSIRVGVDNSNKLYSEYEDGEKYFETSKSAKTLVSGTLTSNGSITYNLRLWIDENAPTTEQSKVFESKIIVTTGLVSLKGIEEVEIGDYIKMTPTSTSYTPLSSDTGCMNDSNCTQNTINPSELNLWRVIKKNEDGTVDVVSEYVSSTAVYFYGQTGYLNYVGALNTIASQYTNEKYVVRTRHMGYSNQIEYCTNLSITECPADTEYETDRNLVKEVIGELTGKNINGMIVSYWLASRNNITDGRTNYDTYHIDNNNLVSNALISSDGRVWGRAFAIRPILTLKSDIVIINGNGKNPDETYIFA